MVALEPLHVYVNMFQHCVLLHQGPTPQSLCYGICELVKSGKLLTVCFMKGGKEVAPTKQNGLHSASHKGVTSTLPNCVNLLWSKAGPIQETQRFSWSPS